jgi:hypothetical protein
MCTLKECKKEIDNGLTFVIKSLRTAVANRKRKHETTPKLKPKGDRPRTKRPSFKKKGERIKERGDEGGEEERLS